MRENIRWYTDMFLERDIQTFAGCLTTGGWDGFLRGGKSLGCREVAEMFILAQEVLDESNQNS